MSESNEFRERFETDDGKDIIKQKLRRYYDDRIVRKDLTKSIHEGANVPVYVLEYLLGQYCNSDNEEIIVLLDENYSYDYGSDGRSVNAT